MSVNSKAIKQRIKSVKNTKKITKAMEMVAAAKMRKAVEATLATRHYAVLARELLQKLSQFEHEKNSLLAIRPVKKVALMLISSNRGLCGSFNSNVFKRAERFCLETGSQVEIDIIGVGKKSAMFAKRQQKNLPAVFDHFRESPDFQDVLPVSRLVIDGFRNGAYDQVFVAYTDYKSSVAQLPVVRQLLPITKETMNVILGELNEKIDVSETTDHLSLDRTTFEPNEEIILHTILPRLLEVQVYQAILESSASEYSARMVAMKSASDAAGDMIKGLSLEYNKNRQAAITREIAEIVGGAVALE